MTQTCIHTTLKFHFAHKLNPFALCRKLFQLHINRICCCFALPCVCTVCAFAPKLLSI